MTRVHILSLLLGLALTIAVVHTLASENFWYWRYWWLDLVMHFGGGAFIGGVALMAGLPRPWLTALGAALIVGVGWEVFEFIIKIGFVPGLWSDSLMDLGMDLLGAGTVCAMMSWWLSRSPLPAAPGA